MIHPVAYLFLQNFNETDLTDFITGLLESVIVPVWRISRTLRAQDATLIRKKDEEQ